MMNRKIKYITLITIISLLAGCSKKGGESASGDLFVFDKSKLGIVVTDQELGIKFNPPKDWELTPASLSKKIESRNNQSDTFIYQPIYVFFNKSNGALLSVGKVFPVDSTMAKGSRINFYKGMVLSKYKNQNSSFNQFVNSRITFNHVRFEKENLISYRVFFQNSNFEIIQFDYSIRKDFLEESELFIKASLGSIGFLN